MSNVIRANKLYYEAIISQSNYVSVASYIIDINSLIELFSFLWCVTNNACVASCFLREYCYIQMALRIVTS